MKSDCHFNDSLVPVVVDVCETEIFAKQSDKGVEIPIKRSITSKSNIMVAWRLLADESSPYYDLGGEIGFADLENISFVKLKLSQEHLVAQKSEFDIEIAVKNSEAVVGRKKCRVVISNDLKQSVVAVKSPTDSIEFKQSDQKCFLHVTRRETAADRIMVPWHITSKDHNSVWNSVTGTVVFEEGQYEAKIEMEIPGLPNASSPEEEIDLILDPPTEGRAEIDKRFRCCSFKIINDIGSGLVEFGSQSYLIDSNQGTIDLIRTRGSAFASVVEWEATEGTAKEGKNFSPATGSAFFAVGQTSTTIPISIHNDPSGTPTQFRINLKKVSCRDVLGPCISAEVHVGSQLEAPGQVQNLSATLIADQQVDIKWSKPNSGGPPSEYVVVVWKHDEPNRKIEQVYQSNVFRNSFSSI